MGHGEEISAFCFLPVVKLYAAAYLFRKRNQTIVSGVSRMPLLVNIHKREPLFYCKILVSSSGYEDIRLLFGQESEKVFRSHIFDQRRILSQQRPHLLLIFMGALFCPHSYNLEPQVHKGRDKRPALDASGI